MKATLSLRSIADARFIALGNVELILSSIRAHDPMVARGGGEALRIAKLLTDAGYQVNAKKLLA